MCKLRFLFAFGLLLGCCVAFDRKLTGVVFSPYVKRAEGGAPIPSVNSYTFQNVKTMLEVVATKFSRVMTHTVDASDVFYVANETYYYDSKILARTAEAAAIINQERDAKALTVFIGVFDLLFDYGREVNTEINVALEAAQKANSIYPGTVEGILFSNHETDDVDWANSTLNWIKSVRSQSDKLGVQIGTEQDCNGISTVKPTDNIAIEIWKIRKEIIKQSDFIICELHPNREAGKLSLGWAPLKILAMLYRVLIRKIKPDMEVMMETSYDSGDEEEHIEGFGEFWEDVDDYASKLKFPMWLNGAFDNPMKLYSHRGWWKLTRNDMINTPEGYVEKVSGRPARIVRAYTPPPRPPAVIPNIPDPRIIEREPEVKKEQSNLGSVVGISVGLILAGVVIAAIIFVVFKKRKSLEINLLTRREIREFKYGLGEDNTALLSDDQSVNVPALKLPYDKSLEIPKGKLEILRDQVLGGGIYGCVCKAIIKNPTDKEVALKMLRHDSPSTALKGFLSEIKILTYLGQHPNIVSICGAYTAEIQKGVVYIATELCPLGSLHKYLLNCQNTVREKSRSSWNKYYANNISFHDGIPYKDMIRWAHEIACGMEYLGQKDVIHADLATRNVLLSSDSTAKITDFGLSRRLYEYQVYTKQNQEPLPWRSMAVESLKKAQFSVQSDVWSYGVTLWEIYSLGDIPFPGMSWSLDFVESLENGLRLKQPHYAGSEMYKIMSDCWRYRPEDRPTFTQLKDLTHLICETYCV